MEIVEHTPKRLRECVRVCDFCKCSDLGVKISESYKLGLYSAGLVVIKSVWNQLSLIIPLIGLL